MTKPKCLGASTRGMEISRKKYLQNYAMKQMKGKMLNGCVKTIMGTLLDEINNLEKALRKLESFNTKNEIEKIQETLNIIYVIETAFKGFPNETITSVYCSEKLKKFLDLFHSQAALNDTELKDLSKQLIHKMATKEMGTLEIKRKDLMKHINTLMTINIKDQKSKCKSLIDTLKFVERKFKKIFKNLNVNKSENNEQISSDKNILTLINNVDDLVKSINNDYMDVDQTSNNEIMDRNIPPTASTSTTTTSTDEVPTKKSKLKKKVTFAIDLEDTVNNSSSSSSSSNSTSLEDKSKMLIMNSIYGHNFHLMDFSCIDDCVEDEEEDEQ